MAADAASPGALIYKAYEAGPAHFNRRPHIERPRGLCDHPATPGHSPESSE
jgi:hypothetical protein